MGADAGLEKTVAERVWLDEEDQVVIAVRPIYSQRDRCPHCRRRCPGYDLGGGRRRWRALDRGTTQCFVEADALADYSRHPPSPDASPSSAARS